MIVFQIMGSKGDMEARVAENTRLRIEEVNRMVVSNKEKALQRLLKLVCDIKPEVHKNLNLWWWT